MVDCFQSIAFLFSSSIHPRYLFEKKNPKNNHNNDDMLVPSKMLRKELFMLLPLLWISSVTHDCLLYKMYLTLGEK